MCTTNNKVFQQMILSIILESVTVMQRSDSDFQVDEQDWSCPCAWCLADQSTMFESIFLPVCALDNELFRQTILKISNCGIILELETVIQRSDSDFQAQPSQAANEHDWSCPCAPCLVEVDRSTTMLWAANKKNEFYAAVQSILGFRRTLDSHQRVYTLCILK